RQHTERLGRGAGAGQAATLFLRSRRPRVQGPLVPSGAGLSAVERVTTMTGRKQQLLKRHRRNKRIALLVALLVMVALGVFVAWWWVPLLLVAAWIAHEAWFADHLFYSPDDDYHYDFPAGTPCLLTRVVDGQLRLDGDIGEAETLILEWEVT